MLVSDPILCIDAVDLWSGVYDDTYECVKQYLISQL